MPAPAVGGYSRHLVFMVGIGVFMLIAALWLGRRFGHHLPEAEQWIAAHGPTGWLVFILLVVVLTSVYVPDTLFALVAGLLFGVAGGTALMVVAAVITANLNFILSRMFLRNFVQKWLDRSPKLAAIERAVNHEGLRFQMLLRLTPIHPVTVNYLLGATNTRYLTFLTGCVGLIPGLFVEVYFGAAAKHIAKASGQVGESTTIHTVLTMAGLLMAVGLLAYVTRLSRRALRQYADVGVAGD